MINSASRAGWDVVLFAIPLVALLAFWVFRLDELLASRKSRTPGRQRPTPPNESRRKSMHSDPDGSPWDN